MAESLRPRDGSVSMNHYLAQHEVTGLCSTRAEPRRTQPLVWLSAGIAGRGTLRFEERRLAKNTLEATLEALPDVT